MAAEPHPLPRSQTTREAETSELDDVFSQIGLLQERLDRLEAENESLKHSLSQQLQSGGVTPANTETMNAIPNAAPSHDAKPTWKTGWNHGIEWLSDDKQFKVHLGGQSQMDGVWIHASDNALDGAGGIDGPKDQDSVGFRRARLRADGTMSETIDYTAQFDFVNSINLNPGTPNTESGTSSAVIPIDLWINFKEVPYVGNVRIGNIKETFGFEHLMSSRFLNTLERAYNQDLFAGPNNNGFCPGVTIYNNYDGDRGTWAMGVFKNTATLNAFAWNVGDGEYSTTSRLTYLPIDDKESETLLHVGVGGIVRDPNDETLRFRTRSLRNGPSNLSTIYADTGNFHAEGQYIGGAELAGVYGPWSFMSEWMGSWATDTYALPETKGTMSGTVFMQAYYAEFMYFLTGEAREYDRKAAVFGRVIPRRNFRWKGGIYEPGAWQLLFRYSNADLNDGALYGGLLQDYTFGVNWYLNPNMKLQVNYVLTERDFQFAGVDSGIIHGLGIRFAHDF